MASNILDGHAAQFVAPLTPLLHHDREVLTDCRIQRVKELINLIETEFKFRLVYAPHTLTILMTHLGYMMEDLVKNTFAPSDPAPNNDKIMVKLYSDIAEPFMRWTFVGNRLGIGGGGTIRGMIHDIPRDRESPYWTKVLEMFNRDCEKDVDKFSTVHLYYALDVYETLSFLCDGRGNPPGTDPEAIYRYHMQKKLFDASKQIIVAYVEKAEKVRGTEDDYVPENPWGDPTGDTNAYLYWKFLSIAEKHGFDLSADQQNARPKKALLN